MREKKRPETSLESVATLLGRFVVRALLREVAAAPKPGLVDRFGSGSHSDMDFMTFTNSALTLGPTFTACAYAGLLRGSVVPDWVCSESVYISGSWFSGNLAITSADADFLSELRRIGIEGERRMFEATGGVNTHRGAIFVVGLLAACVGVFIGAGSNMRNLGSNSRRLAARVVQGISKRDLLGSDTHGGNVYRSHGFLGVRGEAESGFASLDAGAMSMLRNVKGRYDDAVCVDALLSLMSVVDDTTVLYRGGIEALDYVKRSAAAALAIGGMGTSAGREAIANMSEEFPGRRISPGGSADLLSAGLFLSSIEHFIGSAKSLS